MTFVLRAAKNISPLAINFCLKRPAEAGRRDMGRYDAEPLISKLQNSIGVIEKTFSGTVTRRDIFVDICEESDLRDRIGAGPGEVYHEAFLPYENRLLVDTTYLDPGNTRDRILFRHLMRIFSNFNDGDIVRSGISVFDKSGNCQTDNSALNKGLLEYLGWVAGRPETEFTSQPVPAALKMISGLTGKGMLVHCFFKNDRKLFREAVDRAMYRGFFSRLKEHSEQCLIYGDAESRDWLQRCAEGYFPRSFERAE